MKKTVMWLFHIHFRLYQILFLAGFSLFGTFPAFALGQPQDTGSVVISITLGNEPLESALKKIQAITTFRFSYDPVLATSLKVHANTFDKKTVAFVLTTLLKDVGLTFKEKGNAVVIFKDDAPQPPQPKEKAKVRLGTVSGKIMDADSGEPLIGSTVIVKSLNTGGITDVDGNYTLTLPSGTYDLEFRYVGYETKLIQNVLVRDGEIATLNVAMKADATKLGEVVVTAEFNKASTEGLLAKQKINTSMTDGISADQMRLTPDNNTAQVLKRVSGVTVQNDRFVTIRGLSDRYNNVMINGASAPSTEPNRRNFSFDIVPSALVDNVVVNKTASPDLPGEFSGGVVDITTRNIPDENFMEFTVATGINSASSKETMISNSRDKLATLGIVDSENKWFGKDRLFNQEEYVRYLNSPAEVYKIAEIGSKIPNRWQTYQYPYSPMQNYQFSIGKVKDGKSGLLGFTSAVTYRNEQLAESGVFGNVVNSGNLYSSSRYKYATAIGGLLNGSFRGKRNRLTWKNLFNRLYNTQHDTQQGYDAGNSQFVRRTSNSTLTNNLIQTRLEGEHSISILNMKLSWNADHSRLVREQPDGRFIYAFALFPELAADPNAYLRYNFNDSFLNFGGMSASVLKENRNNAGLNLSIPFSVNKSLQKIKLGYSINQRKAEYDATSLRIMGASFAERNMGRPYYEMITPQAVLSGELIYKPAYLTSAGTGDRYTGNQTLQGFYGMVDAIIVPGLRVAGGYRLEMNRMNVNTIFYQTTTGLPVDSTKTYHELDLLPSVNVIYDATDKFTIRSSFGKTLSRPDFVERSPYLYYDYAEQLAVWGETALEITRIKNYDFRLEYRFSPSEIISGSVFYKTFDKPIERFFNFGTVSNTVTYKNLYDASAKGIELNFIKNLQFAGNKSWLSHVFISGNFTLLEGKIRQLMKVRTNAGTDSTYFSSYNRPIQGLSPYIINGGILYQTERWSANIVYNRYGRRVVNGGTEPALIQFENPRDVIDFQFNYYFLKQKLHVRFNISDLLNQPSIIYANTLKNGDYGNGYSNGDPKGERYNEDVDYLLYKVRKGVNYSIALSYRF